MKFLYFPLSLLLALLSSSAFGQPCPPPGFPEPGNNCAQAPILCPTLDGYCSTINNNNQSQSFPCCNGFTLNNDEWFAFFAGSTTIEIQVVPSNCNAGGQQGLQAAIYSHCPPGSCGSYLMDAQCSCTTNPFILISNNFVVGQVYYFVIDGCGGNVCDYTIHVLQGSTAGFAPADPGPITGPTPACAGTSSQYSIDPVNGASIYTWTVTPAGAGTVTGTTPNATVNWAAGFSGTATVCVKTSNLCFSNPTESCFPVEVLPKPTATISGSGVICSNSGGTVDLTVTLTGDAPWEFVYKIGNAVQPAIQTSTSPYTIVATMPGTYTLVSVKSLDSDPDCNGTVSGSATITQVTLNPTAVNTAAVCGQSNGAVNLSVTGGNAPYTYIWAPGGETTQDLNNVPPGSYTVTITDNNNCTAVFTATVNDNITNPVLSAVITNNTTCNGANGAINLSVTPNGSWNYIWAPGGEITQDLTGLMPGDYTVTVTQGPTCSASATYTVADVPNLPMVSSTQVNTTCDLTNGSINISVSGGTTPYTYLWAPGGQTTQNLTNLLAGDYTVTVTGANGCTGTTTVNVTNNNPPINLNANIITNTSCNSGNGSIDLSVTPNGTYTYSWAPGGQTTQDISNLIPGDYDVTVTGQGSCTASSTFTVPDDPNEPDPSAVATQSTCDLPNGSINASVTGGVSPYTYIWSPGGQTTQDLTNIIAGDYTLTVTGANGCTGTVEVTVSNNNPQINITAVITPNTVCNATPNGSINVSVSPNGTYTYQWSTGLMTQDLTTLSPGSYTVTVSAGGSCTAEETFEVPGNPNQPSIDPNITNSSCDFANGAISISVTGGTSPYTYIWAPGGQTTKNLSNIVAGTYTVTVTSANGCTSEATIDVQNVNPTIDLNATTQPNTACNSNYNGSINLSVFPSGTYTYIWSPGGQTTQDLTNVQNGTYFVTVSAGGSCTEVASFDVDYDPNLPSLSYSVIAAKCGLPNGSINLSVSNGTVPYTYSWSSGPNTQDLSNIPAGFYTVTVTAANGCTAEETIEVPNDDIPVDIDATVKGKSSCISNNGSINLQITPSNAMITWSIGGSTKNLTGLAVGDYTVTVSAGGTCTASATFTIDDITELPVLTAEITPAVCGFNNGSVDLMVDYGLIPYTYDWAHISGTNNPQDLSNLTANNYVVTVTTSAGCTDVLFAAIDNDVIQIEISGFASDDYSCTSNNGYIDLDVTPSENYTYDWAHIAGVNNTQDPQNLAAGTYSVTVTFGACNANASFTIQDAAVLPSISISPTAATCGQSDGAVNVSVSGATPPLVYNWSNIPGNNNPQNLANVPPGVYTVTVTDFYDCTASATATVVNSTIAVNISANPIANTSCAAPNGGLDISVLPVNNNYVYTWSNMATTQDLTGIAPGIYSVTVSAGVGCTSEGTFIVPNNTVDPKLDAIVVAAICSQSNGSIDMNVTGGVQPYVFAWSNMAATEDIANVFPGNYSFTVTDANSCSSDTTLNVANNSNTFTLSGVVSPYNNCAMVNGSIDLSVTPAAAYTYLWSSGEITQDLTNIPAGTYTVQVTESGSCIASATFFITDDRTYPTLNQNVTPELCNLSDADINLSVLGGLAPFTYKWTGSSQTTEDLSGIGGGIYTVTVTGANNCSETATITVPENAVSFALAGAAVANTSCVTLNGSVDLNINPSVPSGGPGYSYKWSNGPTTEDLTAVAPGTYTVTVSAGGTCTNTASFTVADDAGAPTISESITQALCGQSSGGINLTINGGEAPYTFVWNTSENTEDLENLVSGTYSVTVLGNNGCQVKGDFTVPEDVVIPSLAGITQPNTACVGPNGSINLSISPSTLTYAINWSSGPMTQNLDNLTPGTYTVSVYGGGACTASATYVINNNTAGVTASGTHVDVNCFGDNTGAVNLILSGGAQPFDYAWTPASVGAVEDPGNLPAGTYTVTVTDAVGCTTTTNFVIAQPSAAVQIACAAVNTVSQPGFTDGDAEVQISGGTAPYSVLWSPGSVKNNVPAGTLILSNLGVGTYAVTVTDAKGCTAVCGFNIILASCSTVVGHMGTAEIAYCGTGCITADYDATGQVLDNNDLLQFILHTGNDTLIVGEIARNSQPTFCFNPLTMSYETTYYISAAAGNKDGSGNVNLAHFCTVVSAGTPIVFHEKPVATTSTPEPITCATLEVGVIAYCNLLNPTFQWSTIDGHIVSANQAEIMVDEKGKYTVIVNANGCSDTISTQVIDIRNNPQANIEASPDDILDCVIDEIVLSGKVEGTVNANAIWIDGSGVIYPGGTILKIDDPGTYQFVILDTVSFCSDTAKVVIGENQLYPLLFVDPPGTLTCAIGSVTLTGGSPIPGIQFNWATVAGQDTTIVGSGTSLNVTTPNTYYLIGVDPVNGCTNAESVTVNADQSYPTADAGAPFSIDCYGQTKTLNGTATGGTGPLAYSWSTSGGVIVSGGNSLTPVISEPGTYTLRVTATGNGCTDTDPVVIAPNEPRAVATVNNPACVGQKGNVLIDTVLGAKPPLSYSVTGGTFGQAGNLISNLSPGNYTIFIEDANGCSTSVDAVILEPEVFKITIDPEIVLALGESFQIEATVNVPLSAIAQVTWTPSTWLSCDTCLSTRVDTPLYSTQYRILVVTKEGCRDDADLLLRVKKDLDVYIPNIFSPNGDGQNENFTVYADARSVKTIKSFQIYSRWGERVFERYNFQPNDPTLGWNGRFNGQEVNPAVFVYYAVVEFIDGQEVLYKGDVTVER